MQFRAFVAPPFEQRSWSIETLDDENLGAKGTLLRQAQQLSGLAFRQFDLQSTRMLVSRNFEEVMGFQPMQTVEKLLELIHRADRGAFQSWTRAQFTTVGRSQFSYRVVPSDGKERLIETHAETLAGPDRKPSRVLLTSRDVSWMRKSEQVIATQADQLKRVQAAALVGTWETDFATGVDHWSPEAWALVEPGGSGEATIERWLAAVHPDDREQAWRTTEEAMETGHCQNEFRVIHPDGSVHWLKGVAVVEKNEAGQATLMRGVVFDVTQRKLAEELLAQQALIVQSTPDFVGWCNLDGRVMHINAAGRRMCGIDETEDLCNRSILQHIAPHEHQRILQEIMPATLRDGVWKGEVDLIDASGRVFPVSKVNILQRDRSDRPQYVATIQRDISREKAAEQALLEADRRKDLFLATLAHELRNPLAPLQSSGEALRQMEAGEPRLGTVRGIIEKQTSHLTRLVEDLLDVARLSSGKLSLRTEVIAIAEVIEEAVEACRPAAEARGHTLEINLPPQGARVDGDRLRLVQVLTNLIGNAVKYTGEGGRIAIGLREEDGAAHISVVDNGIGIAAEFLPKVFDAFAQAGEHQQKAAGGLGLGLMLVKQLVELHHGKVVASSDGPGKGARFDVVLPLTIAPRASTPAEGGLAASALRSVGVRVLVIDDYAAIRDAMELMLTMRGFMVETAPDGPTALARIPVFKPDAVLLDVRMPGMSGHEIARAIRAMPDGAGIRIIAMTGNSTPEDRLLAIAAGCDEHLVKPAPADRLVELLVPARPERRAVA